MEIVELVKKIGSGNAIVIYMPEIMRKLPNHYLPKLDNVIYLTPAEESGLSPATLNKVVQEFVKASHSTELSVSEKPEEAGYRHKDILDREADVNGVRLGKRNDGMLPYASRSFTTIKAASPEGGLALEWIAKEFRKPKA